MLAASTNTITGKPFIKLNSVDSTNNYAMQAIKNGTAKHGTAYFAYEQTTGKGQRNKQWLSNKGENIILSVVLETNELAIKQKFFLNTVTALSVLLLFNKYTTENIKIKWPNDIYCSDRKAAGILIENIVSGNKIQNAVAGFGVNINQTQFDAALSNAISLKQITGETYNVVELAEELCFILQDKYLQLTNQDFEALMSEYNQHLYKKDCMVKFKKNDIFLEALVINVDNNGKLIVEISNNKSAFEHGSIEWIID